MAKSKHPLSIVVSAIDQVTKPMRRVEEVIEKTLAPARKLRGTLRFNYRASGIPRFLSGFSRMARGIGGAVRALGSMVVKLSAVGVAGTAAALALLRHFAGAGDEIVRFSQRVGVSTRQLQRWRYSAEQSGIETETFNQALMAFERRAAESIAGNQEMADIFAGMGIAVRDANGELKSATELLPDVAEWFKRTENATLRLTVADKLFEGEGVALIDMLRGGADGLRSMGDEAERVGAVVGDDALQAAASFRNVLTRVTATLKGLAATIAGEVMPYVTDLFTRLQEWIATSSDDIRAWVQGFMERLPERISNLMDRLREFWASLEPVISRLRAVASWLSENQRWVGALAVGIAGLAAVMMGPLIASLAVTTKAVFALGVAFLTTPVGWITAAIAAIVAAIVWLKDNWDWLGERFDAVVGWIVEKVAWLRDKTVGVFEDIGGWVKGLFGADGEVEQAASRAGDIRDGFARGGAGGRGPAGGPNFDGYDPGEIARGGGAAPPAPPAMVRVAFDNAPEGLRVEQERTGNADVELDVGYAMPGVGG